MSAASPTARHQRLTMSERVALAERVTVPAILGNATLSNETMALPATPLTVGAGAVPVLDAETTLERLPAEARAQLAWARRPIEEGIHRLRTEPMTDELVATTTDRLVPAIQAIGRAAWRALATNPAELRAALMQDLQREQARLADFVQTDEARDTLSWIVSLFQWSFALPPLSQEQVAQVDDAAWAHATASPDLLPSWRGMVTLMAASEEAKHGTNRERARELLDVAFLELTAFRNVMRRYGVSLPVFPFETTDQRRERVAHYAAQLRSTLNDDDASTLVSARMHNLR